jgi:CRISPR-associated protein Cmr4
MNNARLLFVHALSPLHAGTGQGVGVIDLPIAREKATGLPYLPGSSLKGTLRDSCTNTTQQWQVFGPPTDADEANVYAGAAQFADARLLLLPVRSVVGTFAWVTSPYILRRFAREARETTATDIPTTIPASEAISTCLVVKQKEKKDPSCAICAGTEKDRKVYLEDLDLDAEEDDDVTTWATWLGERVFPSKDKDAEWRKTFQGRFCIIHDDALSFLLTTATEVIARVRLEDDAKTVARGALWYEEALPAETILAGLALAAEVKKSKAEPDAVFRVIEGLTEKALQFGGKATVGRGLCRLRLV